MGTVAIHSDVSRADESNRQRHGWPSTKLLFGIWVCLGLAFVWLAWSAYHSPGLVRSFVTTAVILAAWLGSWYALACRRHHRRLLSSMQSSEHAYAERALPENEAHYWALFENASDFIYTLDMHGHFTTVNKTGERILGYARDELVHRQLADLMSPRSEE